MLIYGDTMDIEPTGIWNWTIYRDRRLVINPFFTGMYVYTYYVWNPMYNDGNTINHYHSFWHMWTDLLNA
jgi:cation diffusion facilitator CzcD-associated flavoprotein CzcO